MRAQPSEVQVLVVDDDASFRAIAREVIDSTPGFVFAGEAGSGEHLDERPALLVGLAQVLHAEQLSHRAGLRPVTETSP